MYVIYILSFWRETRIAFNSYKRKFTLNGKFYSLRLIHSFTILHWNFLWIGTLENIHWVGHYLQLTIIININNKIQIQNSSKVLKDWDCRGQSSLHYPSSYMGTILYEDDEFSVSVSPLAFMGVKEGFFVREVATYVWISVFSPLQSLAVVFVLRRSMVWIMGLPPKDGFYSRTSDE